MGPSGDEVKLQDRTGDSQDNIIKTFDMEKSAALQSLVGQNIQGTWRLRVADHAGRDIGKLNRWALEITL